MLSTKFLNFEIVLIYFLLLIPPWPQSPVVQLLCSKDNSRLVRKIVRSKWTPILDKYQVKLPLECPLNPFRDFYAPRQEAKKRDRPTQWTCRLCGKSFYQEKFLDQHFERRHHASTINRAEDAVCLADLCDIMRCDVFQTEESSSSLHIADQHIATEIEVWGDSSLGQNSALAKANAVYLSLMPLRAASTLGATRAAKVQTRQLCQEQSGGQNTFKDAVDVGPEASATAAGDKAKANTNSNHAATKKSQAAAAGQESAASSSAAKLTANAKQQKANRQTNTSTKTVRKEQADELKTAPSGSGSSSTTAGAGSDPKRAKDNKNKTLNGQDNNSNGNVEANGNGNGNNMQRARANCKPEELAKLKAKCEYLVRSCIGSLLLSMSDQAFKDMEVEMNKAVCWYLSCDRYWEDGRTLEPRAFPWGLILVLILVLSTGICFCYYIIWILFDSEETGINTHSASSGAHHPYVYAQPAYHHMPYPAGIGATHGPEGVGVGPPPYYYQQGGAAGPQQLHDLYPEPVPYDYRHSPRRYIDAPRPPGTAPPTAATGGITTPLHHHQTQQQQQQQQQLVQATVYPQDILDLLDYTNSGRPIATSVVSSGGSSSNINALPSNAGGTGAISHHPPPTSSSASNIASAALRDSDPAGVMVGGGGVRHYNTHPRQLGSQHRHVGASQQSLRASSSTRDIIQNEVGHEHYIYVTYPPDLKKRFFEKYE